MKKFLLIFCALFVAQVAFGALDRDYFDYTQAPEYEAIPTTKYVQPTVKYNNNTANLSAQATEPVEEEE